MTACIFIPVIGLKIIGIKEVEIGEVLLPRVFRLKGDTELLSCGDSEGVPKDDGEITVNIWGEVAFECMDLSVGGLSV